MSRRNIGIPLVLLALAITILAATAAQAAPPSIKWGHDFNSGVTQALKAKHPMLVDFYTDWCGWCSKLERDVYTDPRVVALSEAFVCVKVDGDKYPEFVKKYKIEGYPTIIFFDRKAKPMSHIIGYKNADGFLAAMKAALKKAK
jgi:thiol:disulfide interchange protein